MEGDNREEYPTFTPISLRFRLPPSLARDRPRSPPPVQAYLEEEFRALQPRIQMPIYQPRPPPPVQAYIAPPEYVYPQQNRSLMAQRRRDARNAEIRRRRIERRAHDALSDELENFILAELFEELPEELPRELPRELPVVKWKRTHDGNLRINPPKRFRYY